MSDLEARGDLGAVRRVLAPSGTLRAAINHNNPLLATRAPDGTLAGLAVDLSKELAQRAELPLALVAYESAGKITAAARDDVWDIGYLAIDPSRADDIEFTAPYVELEGMYAVPEASSLRGMEDVDRAGVRLGVTAGSAYDLYLTRHLRHAQLIRAVSNPQSIELLYAGAVDVLAAVRTLITRATTERAGYRMLGTHFMTIPQAAGVPRGRGVAARYVSGFIEEARRSGLIAALLQRHGLGPDDALIAGPSHDH